MDKQYSFLFLVVCLIILFSHAFPSTLPHSLSKDSSLSVENPQDVLISPDRLFTAGFHPIGENAFCFAIWFISKQNKTLVWMANRDKPVNGKHSKLSLHKDGNLVLTDAGQFISWQTNTASAAYKLQLILLDSGNLVLQTSTNFLLWQSFDYPTDTLLPNQPLTRYTQLVSTRSKTNQSSGFYKLFFDDDNVLRLAFKAPETSSIYWPDPWRKPDENGRYRYNDTRIAVFDSSGYFISSDRVHFRAADFGEGPLRRLTLDFDGNLRLYSLEEDTNTWVVSWQVMSNSCRIHSACGPNSVCNYHPSSGRTCSCLPWFKVKNDMDWSYGCEPKFKLLCNLLEVTFVEFKQHDFYGYNIHLIKNQTFDSCKQKCLELCNCKGFEYKIDPATASYYNCYLKRLLRNGYYSRKFLGSFFLKLPKELMVSVVEPVKELKLDCSRKPSRQLVRAYTEKRQSALLKILLWVASVIGLIEIICMFLLWFCLYMSNHQKRDKSMQPYILAATGFRNFTYSELKKASRGFSEEIGRGSSGVVYKGILSDHRVAAIKRLDDYANQGEAEFLAEVSTIGRLNHMNLIEMWGYCANGKHRLLVYEFMDHGSLADNLYSNALGWEKRFAIAMGTAKCLAYLHEECLEWILHCDIKPQNILLDIDYEPKVADFGLSKLLNRGGDNLQFSKIRGTRGYMAPEWIFNLGITSKVDVYSYGIVLLEMVTGRSPTTGIQTFGNGDEIEEKRLVQWVREKVKREKAMTHWIDEVADPLLRVDYDVAKMETLVRVALHCVVEEKDARPTMRQVVEMLLHPDINN